MSEVLHPEIFNAIPFTGDYIRQRLEQRVGEVALAAPSVPSEGVSVVIRTKNDNGPRGFLRHLLNDIAAQAYNGAVQVVVVDTESTDGTAEIARAAGATLIPICQEGFSYPKALNIGFREAKYPYILSLVGHSLLAHRSLFRIASAYFAQTNVAGISGLDLPSTSASMTELIGAAITHPNRLRTGAMRIRAAQLGSLAANKSFIRKEAWEEVGGFDESYGAGGEDEALARSLLAADWQIYEDPTLAIHHSHGLGPIGYVKQVAYWQSISGQAQPFDERRLRAFRKD